MVAVELVDIDGLVRFPPLTLNRAPALQPGMRIAFGESAWEVIASQEDEAGVRIELRHVRRSKAVEAAWPTVNETLPVLREACREGNVLWLHEHDWRQAELIDVAWREVAERILGARDGRGVYVRGEIPFPLHHASLTLQTLRDTFRDATWFDAVGLQGLDAVVAGGFAFQTPQLFYGREQDGVVESLSLEAGHDPRLRELCTRHHLLLVDWCYDGFVTEVQYRSLLRR
ncbi:MAG: hypothetical protein ACYCW6_09150 [Candidatus Xenobia bacterium]